MLSLCPVGRTWISLVFVKKSLGHMNSQIIHTDLRIEFPFVRVLSQKSYGGAEGLPSWFSLTYSVASMGWSPGKNQGDLSQLFILMTRALELSFIENVWRSFWKTLEVSRPR